MRPKLVSNVAEFGLFKSVATSRTRLIIVTVLCTALLIAFGLWSADFIMNTSASVVLNIGLITLNMIAVMVCAYLQTLTLGDLFFKGPWREQVILGERPWREDPDAASVVTDHNAEFMILLILLVIGNALLINVSAGNFIDTYHEEGFFRARLRSKDPQERLQALKDMTDPTQYDLWTNENLHGLVTTTLEDPDASVRAQGAWNTGIMAIDTARPTLQGLLSQPSQPVEVQSEAAIALGRLGRDTPSRRAIEALLARAEAQPGVKVGALKALGLMRDPASYDAIVPLAELREPEDVSIHALWALHRVQSPQARVWLRAQLDSPEEVAKLSPKRHCALLDAMKMVSTPDDVNWARKRFLQSTKDVKCERIIWEERDERRRTILFSDTLRTKYLKIVANSGKAAEYRTWFQRIVNDPSEPWSLRQAASDIIKQLNQAGL